MSLEPTAPLPAGVSTAAPSSAPAKPSPDQKEQPKKVASGNINIEHAKAYIKTIGDLLERDTAFHILAPKILERLTEIARIKPPNAPVTQEEKDSVEKLEKEEKDLRRELEGLRTPHTHLHDNLEEKTLKLRDEVEQELHNRLKGSGAVTKADVRRIGDHIIADLKIKDDRYKYNKEFRFTAIDAIYRVECDYPSEAPNVNTKKYKK